MSPSKFSILLALVALLALTGADCVVKFSSGTFRDKDEGDEEDEHVSTLATEVNQGRFIDTPVQGIGYASGSVDGLTGENGKFLYEAGQPVRFFIGDIVLGEAPQGAAVLTPLDLVPGGDIDTPAVINIARLLQSLDALPGDARITLPDSLHASAQDSNEALSASIESLDFHDDNAFVNAASQIIATLTAPYPFTATLVDSETARQHLLESLAAEAERGRGISLE
jgi:penicillin amidase